MKMEIDAFPSREKSHMQKSLGNKISKNNITIIKLTRLHCNCSFSRNHDYILRSQKLNIFSHFLQKGKSIYHFNEEPIPLA